MNDKKEGKGVMSKTWERCKSIGRGRKPTTSFSQTLNLKSKSWNGRDPKSNKSIAPEGCFSVYVGPQMQRFVIKTEYANHPLFKMLLEEAESEYGYNTQGPLALPCHVDIFYKVLMEMDSEQEIPPPRGCVCVKPSSSSYNLLRTSPMLSINHF